MHSGHPDECSKAASNVVGPTECGEIGRTLCLEANHRNGRPSGRGGEQGRGLGRTSCSPEEQGEAARTRQWGQDTAAPADNLNTFALAWLPVLRRCVCAGMRGREWCSCLMVVFSHVFKCIQGLQFVYSNFQTFT